MKKVCPRAYEFDRDLEMNGVSPAKFLALPEKDRKLIIGKYCKATGQRVSNRRFVPEVHRKVAEREKKKFFSWLKTLRCYPKICS